MTEADIDKALLEVEKGLEKYCWIQEQFYMNDVTANRDFQRKYNGFYRVRRSAEWQMVYYRLMEDAKSNGLGFRDVLLELRKHTGWLEASFASKLIATVHPDRPKIDRFVLKNFGLSLPRRNEADRESKAVMVYDGLINKYMEFMSSSTAQVICARFEARYPWANITDLKKVDLVLWQTRMT
ncbi:MAG: hypothetical protein HZA17_00820 [Nitrospirae bacterium]|nr:hypothetical protein [Nitrospirota bacterium]